MQNTVITDIRYKTHSTEYHLHYHEHHEIVYVTAGKCTMQINDKLYFAQAGDLIVICNLDKHSTKITEYPYERYVLTVNSTAFEKQIPEIGLGIVFKQRGDNFYACLHMGDSQTENLFLNLMREKNTKDVFSTELSVMYLKELLISIIRKHPNRFAVENSKTAAVIMKAQTYMEKNFRESISIENLARKFYMNKYYFTHQFRDFAGVSPKQYLTRVRLRQAVHLAEHTDLSVTDITEQCGFSDVNNFIRIFKKEFGMPPMQYRNKKITPNDCESKKTGG